MVGRSAGLLRVGREGGLRRGRREYVLVGSIAACSCALSCAHGKTGMGVQPARGMPRAHAAHAPAQPTLPATENFRARPPRIEEKQKQKPGHFRGQIRFPAENGSDPLPLETQRSCRPTPGYRMGRARVGWRGVRGMDAAAKPGTGLRRPPPTHPGPAPRNSRPPTNCCCCCCCCCCCFKKPAAGSAAAAAARKPEYVPTPHLNPRPSGR